MSGGSYNYIYNTLSEECEGAMYDEEMNDLVKDLCKVLHDLEWWQSCDISEEDYRKTVAEFKKKWFHSTENKADNEIKVGDEVMVDERSMIVLGIDSGKWKHLWCPSNGFTYSNILTSEMTKTGRHFDVQNMFKQIKSSEDK